MYGAISKLIDRSMCIVTVVPLFIVVVVHVLFVEIETNMCTYRTALTFV